MRVLQPEVSTYAHLAIDFGHLFAWRSTNMRESKGSFVYLLDANRED